MFRGVDSHPLIEITGGKLKISNINVIVRHTISNSIKMTLKIVFDTHKSTDRLKRVRTNTHTNGCLLFHFRGIKMDCRFFLGRLELNMLYNKFGNILNFLS